MKTTKKIFAIILALVLTFAFGVTAFAEAPVTIQHNGSITIENATVGKEYAVYKIFDATYSGTDKAAYYINSTDPWYNLVAASGLFKLSELASEPGRYSVTKADSKTDDDITDWLKSTEVTEAVKDMTPTAKATATGATLKFTPVNNGYYYITTGTGTICTITNANNDIKVVDKSQEAGWGENGGKFVKRDDGSWDKDNSANIGDTIEYKVVADNAPNYDQGKRITEYTIIDQKGAAIWINFHSIKVFVNGTEVTGGFITDADDDNATGGHPISADDTTTTLDNCKWYLDPVTSDNSKINITVKWYDSETKQFFYTTEDGTPSKIEIYYTATLLENANIGKTAEKNKNIATISWKQEGNGNRNGGTSEVVTYTYGLNLVKKETNSDIYLEGAEFQLKDKNGNVIELVKSKTDNVYYVKNDYTLSAKCTDVEDKETSYSSVITPADGQLLIKGLKEGEYTLTELEAPDGYNQLSAPVSVALNSEKSTGEFSGVQVCTTVINNSKGTILPSTGGKGTMIFIIVGALAVIGAGIFLVTNKRMSKEAF